MDALAKTAKPSAYPCAPRPLFLFLLVALCLAGSNLPLASSQGSADSCSTVLSLGSAVPFSTTGLTCSRAWASQDFILRFGKAATSNNTWSFVLSAPDNGGYIAIGFSPTGRMVGSSAVAGWAGSARRYYLGGMSSRACPPDQGKLTLARAPTVVSKGSRLYLAFQLAEQPPTDVVYAVGPSGGLPGSNGFLPQHQDMASGTISLAGGSSPAPDTGGGGGGGDDNGGEENEEGSESKQSGEGNSGDDDGGKVESQHNSSPASGSVTSDGGLSLKRRHGVLATVSWGAVVLAGAALARFA